MMNPTAVDPPIPYSCLARQGGIPGKFPLTVGASVLLHGLLAFALSNASAADQTRPEDLGPTWIEFVAAPPAPPPQPVEEPPAPPPVEEPPPPAPKPRAVPLAVRHKPEPVKPEPKPEPEPAPEPPAPAVAASQPKEVAEPAAAPAPLTSGAQPEAGPNAVAVGQGGIGSSAVGTMSGRGTGTGRAAPSGPSEADRKRAQSRYVHSLEGLIRAHTRYPRAAARAGLQGRVVLGVRIAADGRLAALRVALSSGHDLLDDAALDAAREVGRFPAPPALSGLDAKQEVRVGVVYVVR